MHNVKLKQAQKILNDILEKSLEVVCSSSSSLPAEDSDNGSGVHLFKHAPRGIVFDYIDEVQRPSKKPKLLPGDEIDEKSKKFKRQLQSVAVNGVDILSAARDAGHKARTKLERKEAAGKAAAKREEERVVELKKIRGERWLPGMAKKRLANSQ
ncbi:OLC1v1016096C2 [Oldenlandia corymbosa var. corymbosa]|uniref:OLC1v1016096C2 n=1 Tax=Oldenlandia corymbosa var. corymbosa TaxID=529605 RepID=A0AAV1E791_OLDCO|nr:OLC1v1016096C2 [Oldenlandia corymbosa var. corymbosa]